MGACRENANLWFHLFSKYGSIKDFFYKKMWRSEYFWQDSFFTYWNRLVGCRFLGHRDVKELEDDEVYCFKCCRRI